MTKELLLARSFTRSPGSRRVHTSFVVSVGAVLVAVTFLMLTLGVYDSYVEKLESITFSIYPHLLVLDKSAQAAQTAAPSGVAAAAGSREDVVKDRCERICRGERVLNPEAVSERLRLSALPSRQRLEPVAEAVTRLSGARSAPLILEERDLRCRFHRDGQAVAEVHHLRLFGVDPRTEIPVPRVDLFLEKDLLARLGDGPTVLIAEPMARTLFGASPAVGQKLTVERDGGPVTVEVAGTFSLGFHAISGNMLIASLETTQTILGMDDRVSYFGVVLPDPYAARRAVAEVQEALQDAGFTVSDWSTLAAGDFQTIRLFRWVLFLVLGMSLIITALSIRNTLSILTLERRRQIGILRSLGLRDGSIRGIFLWIATGIGLVGAAGGLVLGSLASLAFGRWLDRTLVDLVPIHGVEMSLHPEAMFQILSLVATVCAATALVSVHRALELDAVSCLTAE